MPKKLDIKHCQGCEDNFYNGQNPYGIKECWERATGKLEKFRLIPIDLRPPYLHIKQQSLPTCYKKKRYVKVKAESLDSKGYWRS